MLQTKLIESFDSFKDEFFGIGFERQRINFEEELKLYTNINNKLENNKELTAGANILLEQIRQHFLQRLEIALTVGNPRKVFWDFQDPFKDISVNLRELKKANKPKKANLQKFLNQAA